MARKAKAKKEDTTPVKEKSNKATTPKVTPSKSNKTSRKASTKATSTAKRQLEHSLNSQNVNKAISEGGSNSTNNNINKVDVEQRKNDSNALVKERDNKVTSHSSTLSLPSVKVEELINRPANSPIVSLNQLRSLSLPTGARINIRSTQPQTSTLSSSSSSFSFPTSSSAVAREVALALNPANSKMQQHQIVSSSYSSLLSSSLQLKNTSSQNDHNTTRNINNITTDMSTSITSSPPLPSPPPPSIISVAHTELESSATARPIRKPRSTFIWHNKKSEEDSNAHKSVKAQRNPRYTNSNNDNNKRRKPVTFSLQPPPPPLIPDNTEPLEKINMLQSNLQESEKVKSTNVSLSITSHTLESHAIALQTPEQHASSTPPALLPPSSTSVPAATFSSTSSSCANNGKALEQTVISSANIPINKLNNAISSFSSPFSTPPVPVSGTSHLSLPQQHENSSTLVLPKDYKELSVSTEKMMPSTSASSITTATTTTPIPAVVAEKVAKYAAASSAKEQTQPTATVDNNNNNINVDAKIDVDAKTDVDNNQNAFCDGWSSLPVNDNATNGNDIIVDNNNISNNNYYELLQMQNKNAGYEYNWEECSEEEQQQYYLQLQRHLLLSEQRLQPSPLPPSISPPPLPTTTSNLFVPYAEEDDNNEEAEVVQQNSSWPATASEYLLYLQRREEMMRNEEENNASYTNYDNINGYDMYSTPANNINVTNFIDGNGNSQISNELQNNWSNVHDNHHLLTPSTITSSCFTPPCTSATNTNNADNLIVNDVNNNGNSTVESNDVQSNRSKPSSIAQYRLTMMRLRAAQKPSSSSTDSDYLTAIKKQIRAKIVQDARNGEANEDMSKTSTFTSSNNNNNNNFSNSTNSNNISAATADYNAKTNTSKNKRNKNRNNRNKSINNSFNSRYSSNNSGSSITYNNNTNTNNKQNQTNKSRNDAKLAQNTKHGNKRKKQQSTVMPEHLPHTWSNVDQHAQKRIRSDYSTNEDNEEANAEKEKCNKLYSTTCDISANYNNNMYNNSGDNIVSESTLSDLRRCIANRHQQWNNNNNNWNNNITSNNYSNVNSVVNAQEQLKSQPEMSSSSAANSFMCANNNTSISPTTLSAPLAHLLGSWNPSNNIANVENGTWTSYRTFSPAHLSTPAIPASSVTSMANVGNNNTGGANYNNYNNINNMIDQSTNANGTCVNVTDEKLYQPEEDLPHSVDRTLPISQRNLLAMKPNLSHVGNDTIFRDEAVIGAGNVVSEEPNSFAALRNAWIAASAALATSTPRSEWQLPSSPPPPIQNEQNGIQHTMYTSPTPSPQPPPELTGTIMNTDTNYNKPYSAYQRTTNDNNKNANSAKRAQFLPSKQKNASFVPQKAIRCVVMDTSSLLDADPGMLNLLIEKWKLCIPYTVIDELDNLNKSVIRDARRFTAQQRAEREHRQKRARELRNWLMSVTMRKGNMIRFQKRAEVIEEYFKRSSNNDDAILGFAVFLRSEDANVAFVTEDKFLRLKAQSELGEVLNNKQLKQLLRLRY